MFDHKRSAIQQFADRAELLGQQVEHDHAYDEAWETLLTEIDALDQAAGSGLAVGRYLLFQVADGTEISIIDGIEATRVHVVHVPSADAYQAEAIDAGGWCVRTVAEDNIRRRDDFPRPLVPCSDLQGKEHDIYQQAFARLLRDLRAEGTPASQAGGA